ncbi:ATP-binding cassette domain-containing protein [Nostoc sp. HG1]|jgi:peptide/nickel transport system ATP-binding protein/Fe3+-transporting ATPase|nr:ATP-binding cassette domain-containing protein [Nostoc sp. HG1]
MLKAEHLSFRYRSQQPWILRDLSLELERGEVVGLTGPSGLGKTTIAKLLAGYLQPTQGKVTCNDQPLSNKGYCPVQLIFQNPELAVNPRWRISKILAEGKPPSTDLLTSLGIHQSWLSRYPHELSGGELQRIAVARSLNSSTHYLIADEMTAMLDANTQALIWQVVMKYSREHEVAILVISHEAALLKRLCVGVAGRRHRTIDLSTLIYQIR